MSINIQLPDGSERELADGATAYDLAESISPNLAKVVLAAKVNGQIHDFHTPLPDKAEVLQIVDKQVKQRCEAAALFADAGRIALEQQENCEIEILQAYLPEALSESERTALVDDVISAIGATSMKEMGKVMAEIQPKAQRRSDMAALSALVKARLSS